MDNSEMGIGEMPRPISSVGPPKKQCIRSLASGVIKQDTDSMMRVGGYRIARPLPTFIIFS